MSRADLVITNARLMTCVGPGLGIVDDAAVVIAGGKIAWAGRMDELDSAAAALDLAITEVPARVARVEARGRLVTPGLVDCHTHLAFAGSRGHEFGLRARGASYQEIGAAGGGIASTLRATRGTDLDILIAMTHTRARTALRTGITTVEVKSGYDLTFNGEVVLLDSIHRAGESDGAPRVVPTLLAHVIPPEAKADRDAYVAGFADDLIPRVAASHLAASVDVYCDEGAFTLDEARRIWTSAKQYGLAVRGHVGQFADLGGAELLAELGALSADHLEQVSDAGIAALARAGVVAVMLPAACVQLRQQPPRVDALRKAGVPLAIASDLNPGTSYCENLVLPMWLATTLYGMTVEEAWLGVTRVAARALGRDDLGVVTAGAAADLVLWDTDEPADIPYRMTHSLATSVYLAGLPVL